jgi:hypothetical protein
MNRRIRVLSSFLPSLLLFACATTTQVVSSSKPAGQGYVMNRVLVVGIAGSLEDRRRFEDEFARKLSAHGLTPYPSYTLFTSSSLPACNALDAAIQQRGIDTILITRFIDKKETTTYVPGTVDYYTFPYPDANSTGSYQPSVGYISSPGYTVKNKTVLLLTNLYKTADQKLLWTATTNTTTQADNADIVRSFIGAVIKRMEKDDLIKKQ